MTEEERILQLLRSQKLTPLNQILDLRISQYGRAIKSLRDKGYIITNHLLEVVNRKKYTGYTLDHEPQEYRPMTQETLDFGFKKEYTNVKM